MERPPPIAVEDSEEDGPLSPGEARLEALIDERLTDEARAEFSRKLALHDQAQRGAVQPGQASGAALPVAGGLTMAPVDAAPATPFDQDSLRSNLRFRGDIPDKTRAILEDWVPGLVAFADRIGLSLRGAEFRIVFYHPDAYASEVRPLPAGQKLPASSFRFNPLYRHYTVRVVLPPSLESSEPMFNVLRTLLTRLYGDIHLREAIYRLEAYQEDLEAAESDVTVGLAEQIGLLAEIPHTVPALESALASHARVIGLNYKRQPGPVRKAFCKDAREDVERGRLHPERRALIEEAFSAYLDTVRADTGAEVERLIEAVDVLNRQTTFQPPEDAPDHDRLKAHQPLHFLRSVKPRLEFLLEAFAGLSEDFEALDRALGPQSPAALSPTAEDRVGDLLAELERRGLARPYLVEGVRLSDDLERKRTGFPLEVHRLLARFPAAEDPEKQFKTLSRKLENSLHQRVYHALLLLRHWIHLSNTGRGETFPRSQGYGTLKGLVANFRFRGPLLEALFLRIGVVLDVAEHKGGQSGGAETTRMRFPAKAFGRVWGQYIAQALLAGFLAERQPDRFKAAVFWRPVENRIAAGVAASHSDSRLMRVLHRIRCSGGEEEGAIGRSGGDGNDAEGLRLLTGLLRQCPPAFRFAVGRALLPPEEGGAGDSSPETVDAWADAVLEAQARSRRNAIVAGEGPSSE